MVSFISGSLTGGRLALLQARLEMYVLLYLRLAYSCWSVLLQAHIQVCGQLYSRLAYSCKFSFTSGSPTGVSSALLQARFQV